MPGELKKDHTDENASVAETLRLAQMYREAADLLAAMSRKGDHMSRAPWRLTAVHAIELFLNAYLLESGADHRAIRKLQHDHGLKAQTAIARGLVLRKKTADHLSQLANGREYLVSRYSPAMFSTLSQMNRITATLNELAARVGKLQPEMVKARNPAK